jgi:Tfp pilus assembly protein PilV
MSMKFKKLIKWISRQEGVSLIEAIILILILTISIPPIAQLLQENLYSSLRMNSLNKASYFAQQRLEQIVADYANDSIGYTGITEGSYGTQTPESGFETDVTITAAVENGIDYKEITVTCTNPQSDQMVSLKTWIVDLS